MASKFETIDIEEDEHYSTDGIVCPYCGYVHDFYDFETSLYYENADFECVNCGKKFNSDCYTSYSWTTKKL